MPITAHRGVHRREDNPVALVAESEAVVVPGCCSSPAMISFWSTKRHTVAVDSKRAYLFGLITQRSKVQILPPQPIESIIYSVFFGLVGFVLTVKSRWSHSRWADH